MKAIVAREFGGPEVLRIEEGPEPVPGASQVLVRVHAAGVNPYDAYMRTGNYAIKPALPYVPGADAAGVVEAVGSGVSDVEPGDRVYVGGTAGHPSYGAYAEKILCDRPQIRRLPPRVTFAQGAAVNVPYVTAWHALHARARLQPGETLLVHGASGGVGLAATQIASAWGATVVGTAGTAEGIALVEAQGARHAVNHTEPGYLDRLIERMGGRGPDVVLENLANVNLDQDLAVAAPGGRIVIVGSRGRVEIDPRKAMVRGLTILGMSFWNIPAAELERARDAVHAGLVSGALSPAVGRELPLADASQAHILLFQPGARGKIVLIP